MHILRNRGQLAILAVSAVWLVLASVWIWGYTVDDAFIGYRYAQNFLEGAGLVFNRGERVEGYTNFLWVILLAEAYRIVPDFLLLSKVLGTLFNVLVLVAGYRLCRLATTEQAPLYGFSLVLIASSPFFIITSVEGLETPLFTLLLCWGVVAYLQALRASRARSQALWLAGSSLLFALLTLTRPDGALAYGLIWLHAAYTFRDRLKNLAIFTLPLLLVYTPYFLWRWQYYGFFFPNTFYAKRGGTLSLFLHGAAETHQFLSKEMGGVLVAGLAALGLLVYPALETTVLGLAAASRFVFQLWSGGAVVGYFRFLVPALPLTWIIAERLVGERLRPAQLGRRGSQILLALFALILLSEVTEFGRLQHGRVGQHAGRFEHSYIALGTWLKRNTPPEAAIALESLGAIPFYSERRTFDTVGLVDTHVARLPGALYEKTDPKYILAQSPDFIVFQVARCEAGPDDFYLAMERDIYQHPSFRTDYQRVGCWDYDVNEHLLLHRRTAPVPPNH